MTGFGTFMLFVVSVLALVAYSMFINALVKKRLDQKDRLVETLILCLPRLFRGDGRSIDFRVQTDAEHAEYLIVKFQCSDNDFICRLYNYLYSLQKYGYKIRVDRVNGDSAK